MSSQETEQKKIEEQEKTPMEEKERLLSFPSKLEEDVSEHFWKYFAMAFFVGLLNNSGFVLVNAASQDIASEFDKQNAMTLFLFSIIICSPIIRILNSLFFIKIRHTYRLLVVIFLDSFGYLVLGFSTSLDPSFGFYTALFGTLFAGWGSTFGDGTALGFLKAFPARVSSGWSSGTGFAGIFGSGLYLCLKAEKLEPYYAFFTMSILILLYWLCFELLVYRKKALESRESVVDLLDDESKKNINLFEWNRVKVVFRHTLYYFSNLGFIYFLEYSCVVGWADRANPKTTEGTFIEQNAYVILGFCYQVGVFISRSSSAFFRIEKTHYLTILQVINYLVYMTIAIWKWMHPVFQIGLMFWVGVVAGAAYGSTYYGWYNSKKAEKNEKELGVNFLGIANDLMILASSVSFLVIDKFWIKDNF